MKNEKKLKQIIAGVLVPSVLLPSCSSPYFFDQADVVSINNHALDTRSSVAVPININLNSEDLVLLNFLNNLAQDVIKNPLKAREFAENPQAVCC